MKEYLFTAHGIPVYFTKEDAYCFFCEKDACIIVGTFFMEQNSHTQRIALEHALETAFAVSEG